MNRFMNKNYAFHASISKEMTIYDWFVQGSILIEIFWMLLMRIWWESNDETQCMCNISGLDHLQIDPKSEVSDKNEQWLQLNE